MEARVKAFNSEGFELLAIDWVQVEPAAKLSRQIHTAAIVLRVAVTELLSLVGQSYGLIRGKTMVQVTQQQQRHFPHSDATWKSWIWQRRAGVKFLGLFINAAHWLFREKGSKARRGRGT